MVGPSLDIEPMYPTTFYNNQYAYKVNNSETLSVDNVYNHFRDKPSTDISQRNHLLQLFNSDIYIFYAFNLWAEA